jgi:ABC-type dipeptide/oligopeptide/nickel transport system permease subunit
MQLAERNAFLMGWRRFRRNKLAMIGSGIVLLIILAAVLAPILAPEGHNKQVYADAYQFPSWAHPMGTDGLGREIWIRLIYGAQISLLVGLVSQTLAYLIGVPIGAVAGYYGGRVDYIIMRFVDAMTAFPSLLFAILVMAVLGPGVWQVLLAIGLTRWIDGCRMTRAQLLQLREADFVLASRSLGTSSARIIWRHMLPNSLSPLIVGLMLGIPGAIFSEAGLSFLGLGISPPTPSWGQMVGESVQYLSYYWHMAVFPALAIALMMLGFTWAGNGLRDVLDPQSSM